jgi:hypothetical protein
LEIARSLLALGFPANSFCKIHSMRKEKKTVDVKREQPESSTNC